MSELEPYKQEFLEEVDNISRSQGNYYQEGNHQQHTQTKELPFKVTNTNEIWNNTKYSDNNWRKDLTTSYYSKEHNESHFKINGILNPDTQRKTFNMRATQISEYSNAKHNNTVFVNPKFTSC